MPLRRAADAERIRALLGALGREARRLARAYLAGGANAVLLGWCETTIDVDLKLEGEDTDALLRAIPRLKEALELNVELAAPDDFPPVADGWQDRGRFEIQVGNLVGSTGATIRTSETFLRW